MCEAANVDTLQDELSNMLHHMYRLGELRKRRWEVSNPKFTDNDFIRRVIQVRGALGALWIRNYDTHQIARVSQFADMYSIFYIKMWHIGLAAGTNYALHHDTKCH